MLFRSGGGNAGPANVGGARGKGKGGTGVGSYPPGTKIPANVPPLVRPPDMPGTRGLPGTLGGAPDSRPTAPQLPTIGVAPREGDLVNVVSVEAFPAYRYIPAGFTLTDPTATDSTAWRLQLPPVMGRYAPAYAKVLVELEHQKAVFRRGDSALVVMAYDTRNTQAVAGAPLRVALAVTPAGRVIHDFIARRDSAPATGVITVRAPWGPLLMSAEVAARAAGVANGPIDVAEMGLTLTHEHIFNIVTPWWHPPYDDSARSRELVDEIWRRKGEMKSGYQPISDGIAAARAGAKGAEAKGKKGPLVLADGTDNPGGGGYNDTTPLLQSLIDAGIRNVAFGTIYDPKTVQQAMKAGVGAEIDVELGGHTDESMGKPVKARALVRVLSDGTFRNDGPMNAGVETQMGPTAVLRLGGAEGGIDVVTVSSRIQTIDLQVFLSQGIDPTTKDVVVVKSVQHFRAAYGPIAREVIVVDSGGLCSPDISRLKFKKLRRPVWPLDGVNDPYAGGRA